MHAFALATGALLRARELERSDLLGNVSPLSSDAASNAARGIVVRRTLLETQGAVELHPVGVTVAICRGTRIRKLIQRGNDAVVADGRIGARAGRLNVRECVEVVDLLR